MVKTDVLIIGAGAVGTAIARELSKYRLKVAVVDKNEDVGGDASKSNSAIIHTGFDASPGTLESQLVVAANPMYDELTKELDVPFKRVGAIMPAVNEEQFNALGGIMNKAFKNKVYDLEYLTAAQVRSLEPEISDKVLAGVYIPRESIIDPFLLVVSQAENAVRNGARFYLSTEVTGFTLADGKIASVQTTAGEFEARYVINAAGIYSDAIADMAGKCDFTENPRKGQFLILDKNTPYKVSRIILPIPTKLTKGKLICPTIHDNLLVGPTAEELTDKKDKAVTAEGLKEIIESVRTMTPRVSERDAITEFCGLRPTRQPEGYHIDLYDDLKGFVNITGIRSTGVTASVAIARYVVNTMAGDGLELTYKEDFERSRRGIARFSEASDIERDELIRQNPLYGHVICRCETVTEAEIVEAIRRPLGARSVDGVKRRVRAGMGRCSGGFCGPRVIGILARELGVPEEAITKKGPASNMVDCQLR